MKQLNGIITSGKVTEEDVQALIESVTKKNRPIQRGRQVIKRTKLSK
jgi:(2Fe-2S) ferredoxin